MTYPQVPQISIGASTDRGRVRDENQDAYLVCQPKNAALLSQRGVLVAVADGMGGHAAGRVASETALRTLAERYYSVSAKTMAELLRKAIEEAGTAVFREAERDPSKRGMGTTLTALAIQGSRAFIGNVGDSRTYLIRKGRIVQLTKDHSVAGELGLDANGPEGRMLRHQLTRALGVEESVNADVAFMHIRSGDTFILCTDGLTNHIGERDILRVSQSGGPEKIASNLVRMACARGGTDNVTVVCVKLGAIAGETHGAGDTLALDSEDLFGSLPVTLPEGPRRRSKGARVWIVFGILLATMLFAGALLFFLFARKQPADSNAKPAPHRNSGQNAPAKITSMTGADITVMTKGRTPLEADDTGVVTTLFGGGEHFRSPAHALFQHNNVWAEALRDTSGVGSAAEKNGGEKHVTGAV